MPIDVLIEGLARGDGVGTLPGGKRVFVPGTAPGDLASVEVVEDRERHARARLIRVVAPGPHRAEPVCRHVAVCGGCQLQHVSLAAQLAAKEDAFYQQLERVGRIARSTIPEARAIVPSPAPLRYRTRARVHVEGGQLGYHARASHELVALEECPQLVPELERLVLEVSARLRRRPIAGLAAIDACTGAGGESAMGLEPGPNAGPRWSAAAESWLGELPGLAGLVIQEGSSSTGRRTAPGSPAPARVLGDPVVTRPAPSAPGANLLGRPDVFAQANAGAAAALVEVALADLGVRPEDEVLELHAGAGTFTLALAGRAARVVAVEEVELALTLAGEAARRAGLGERVRFVVGDAARVAADLASAGRRFDLCLLDPPRAGARAALPALIALAPRRIAYASCDPGTLARDLRDLVAGGYRMVAATPVDMFPQTFHVEGVVVLERV